MTDRGDSLGENVPVRVGLDYLEFRGPIWSRDAAVRWCDGLGINRTGDKAARIWKSALQWGPVWLGWREDGQGGGEWKLDLKGEALSGKGNEGRLGWLRSILGIEGAACRRLDVAVDREWDGSVSIFDQVEGSALDGTLCGAKRTKQVRAVTELGQVGRTVYVGVRGSEGSGRFARLYDKGVETRTDVAGRWLRWEAEFSGSVAADLAVRLAGLPEDEALDFMVSAALGAFDFREVSSNRGMDRRERCAWWSKFCAGIDGARVVHCRGTVPADYRRSADWRARSVYPGLIACARALGLSVGAFVEAELATCGSVVCGALPAEYLAGLREAFGSAGADPFAFSRSYAKGRDNGGRRSGL